MQNSGSDGTKKIFFVIVLVFSDIVECCHGKPLGEAASCYYVSTAIWMTFLSPRSEATECPETSA